MLIPFTTALISSRKSVRKRNGSGELLATRAIKPVISSWQAIIRPFNSSIIRPERVLIREVMRVGRDMHMPLTHARPS
jgi:hypothetical protein